MKTGHEIKKEAKIVKRKNKWCVIGHKRDKSGKYRNFGCYDTKEEAKKRLGQIHAFKSAKITILNIMTVASDTLEKKGMIHIADAVVKCAESVAVEDSKNDTVIRLAKIVSLLKTKRENKIAEQLDVLIPEVLSIEECGADSISKKHLRLQADKAYLMVKNLYDKYISGEIDTDSFEYNKMKEIKEMLKKGFSLGIPKSLEEIPKNVNNWWEYFSKRGK